MTPFNWVCTASIYNKKLDELNHDTQKERALKMPHALMDKLYELELKLITRIISDDYQCKCIVFS